MIYFDNSATTAPSKSVIDAVTENLNAELFGNPGSLHRLGMASVNAYEECLSKCGKLLGCTKDELYFTSCGTESANTAIEGYMSCNKRAGKKIISTETEHKCTLETLKRLEGLGYEVVYIPVDKAGKPKLDVLENENMQADALVALNAKLLTQNVVFTPHVAGWTVESKYKLAAVLADKMIEVLK